MRAARVRANVISYNTAISACEKSGEWQIAVQLFQEMSGCRLDHDVKSYGSAISACEKGGEWSQALYLLQQMQAATRICLVKTSSLYCGPNQQTRRWGPRDFPRGPWLVYSRARSGWRPTSSATMLPSVHVAMVT